MSLALTHQCNDETHWTQLFTCDYDHFFNLYKQEKKSLSRYVWSKTIGYMMVELNWKLAVFHPDICFIIYNGSQQVMINLTIHRLCFFSSDS